MIENRIKIQTAPHAIFPVCEGGLDQVLGLIHVKDLLVQSLSGEELDILNAIHQPVFVPEAVPALKVLESFKATGNHIALVTDEYGVVQGLVTMTDMLEGIVGDIPTVDELQDLQVIRREDGSWLLDGMLSVDELKDLLRIEYLPDEEKANFHTVGGFMTQQLERIPAASEYFESSGFRFEVMDMDGNRVDKILVQPLEDQADKV